MLAAVAALGVGGWCSDSTEDRVAFCGQGGGQSINVGSIVGKKSPQSDRGGVDARVAELNGPPRSKFNVKPPWMGKMLVGFPLSGCGD